MEEAAAQCVATLRLVGFHVHELAPIAADSEQFWVLEVLDQRTGHSHAHDVGIIA